MIQYLPIGRCCIKWYMKAIKLVKNYWESAAQRAEAGLSGLALFAPANQAAASGQN